MPVNHQPDEYNTVTPYLIVPGVATIIDFLKQAFDAVELERMEMPDGSIAHAEVRIGDSVIMFGEPRGDFKPMPTMLYIYVPDTDETYRRALNAGAKSVMEPADQFYGDRNAGVQDLSGNMWWIATHVEDVSPEEMQRRMAERSH
ncbi:MAG: VOC family protein [Bacteroidetes bacterium]|nr:MAG: VOC family protein [Bacteroidota bacterium]